MYLDFYNLHTLPFENTPDPSFFFASEQHREALAAIEYTIRMRKGFVLITGEIGAGKTTVGRTMAENCHEIGTLITIGHGHTQSIDLLRQILRGLQVKFRPTDDHSRLLERIQKTAIELLELGKPMVLFIDEAQTLSDNVLEELRLLSNFDTSTQKPIQVVLIGQPELRSRIREPQLQALRQRIVMAKQLQPFDLTETQQYIQHRVAAASKNPEQIGVDFSTSAIQVIHQTTTGVPRLINVACDNCLLLAFVRQTRTISPDMISRVIEDMVPSFDDVATESYINNDLESYKLAGNY